MLFIMNKIRLHKTKKKTRFKNAFLDHRDRTTTLYHIRKHTTNTNKIVFHYLPLTPLDLLNQTHVKLVETWLREMQKSPRQKKIFNWQR